MSKYKIHDLPRVDKPREKLIKYGPEKLSESELLGIILRTGIKGKNAIELAGEIIQNIGDEKNVSHEQIMSIAGIGPAKACEVVAVFELGKRYFQNKKTRIIYDSEDVWNELKDIRESKKEHFIVFFLDSRNQEIKREVISIGTINTSLVHPREVFEPAVKYLATHIILAHNHPSGNLEPSLADIQMTSQLLAAAAILGIDIIDHVIVTSESYLSFEAEGLLKIK